MSHPLRSFRKGDRMNRPTASPPRPDTTAPPRHHRHHRTATATAAIGRQATPPPPHPQSHHTPLFASLSPLKPLSRQIQHPTGLCAL